MRAEKFLYTWRAYYNEDADVGNRATHVRGAYMYSCIALSASVYHEVTDSFRQSVDTFAYVVGGLLSVDDAL